MEYLVTQPAKAGGNPCPAEEAGPNHQQERFFQLSKKSAAAASRHRRAQCFRPHRFAEARGKDLQAPKRHPALLRSSFRWNKKDGWVSLARRPAWYRGVSAQQRSPPGSGSLDERPYPLRQRQRLVVQAGRLAGKEIIHDCICVCFLGCEGIQGNNIRRPGYAVVADDIEVRRIAWASASCRLWAARACRPHSRQYHNRTCLRQAFGRK